MKGDIATEPRYWDYGVRASAHGRASAGLAVRPATPTLGVSRGLESGRALGDAAKLDHDATHVRPAGSSYWRIHPQRTGRTGTDQIP
jgi:hypothetical protein